MVGVSAAVFPAWEQSDLILVGPARGAEASVREEWGPRAGWVGRTGAVGVVGGLG